MTQKIDEIIEGWGKTKDKISPWPWTLDHDDTFVSSADVAFSIWYPELESQTPMSNWVCGDIANESEGEEDYRGPRLKEDCRFISKAPETIDTLIQFAKEAIEVVRDCEAIIDAANGVYGSTQPTHALCLICRSNEYNSEVGIVHDDKCPVKQIRNFKEKWNKE